MASPSDNTLRKQAAAETKRGNLIKAHQLLVKALRENKKDAGATVQLVSLTLRDMNKVPEAMALLPKMLRLAPRSARAHELAAETHSKMSNHDIAVSHAEKALKLDAKDPDRLFTIATIMMLSRRYDDARSVVKRALHIRPDHLRSRLLLTEVLIAAGDRDQAEALCREIYAQEPYNLPNFINWGRLERAQIDDPIYTHLTDTVVPMLRKANDKRLPRVLQLLGKVENQLGHYTRSFQYYAQAKAAKAVPHNPADNSRMVNDMITGLSRADFFGASGHDSESPVLIVGMPRSGSTLLEQILSSHPQIGGIGESEHLRRIAHAMGYGVGDGSDFVKAVRNLSPARAKELAQIYLDQSTAEAPGKRRIVNKNLHNFEVLGLFAKLFPRGRILLALRDPMDTCVSCYLQPLRDFHSYTNDLAHLGRYYREFRQLVAHWEKTIPNPILPVFYEDVVADTQGVARKVIAHLGLEWDAACLDYQKNDAPVRTLSVAQVRKPIYKSSVKRWKRYEDFLDPLKAELTEFYPDGF